jgi:negative regulator of sigma E activity
VTQWKRPMQSVSHLRRPAAALKVVAALSLAASLLVAAIGGPLAAAVQLPTRLSQLLATYNATAVVRGVVVFDAVPTAVDASGLASLGLSVQRMHHLPLALV